MKTKTVKKAGPSTKALFTKMCADIEKECHKIVDKAANKNADAMLCVLNGPMEVLHQAITRVEDRLNKQLKIIKAAK